MLNILFIYDNIYININLNNNKLSFHKYYLRY